MTNHRLNSDFEVVWEGRGQSAAGSIGVIATDAQKAFERDTSNGGIFYEDYIALTTVERPAVQRAYLRGFHIALGINK